MKNLDTAFLECNSLRMQDNLKLIDAWIVESSDTHDTHNAYSLIKGRRAHLIIMQDGTLNVSGTDRLRTGFWIGGTRHFSQISMKINGKDSLKNFRKYVRRPGYIYRNYGILERIDYVHFDDPTLSIVLKSNSLMEIGFKFVISHGKAWPDSNEAKKYVLERKEQNHLIIKSEIANTHFHLKNSSFQKINLTESVLSFSFFFTNNAHLLVSEDKIVDSGESFEELICNHAKSNEYSILVSPSFELNKAFYWAKHDIFEMFSETEAGEGFYAGLPQYSWFFGRDGLWTSFAATECGMEHLTESHLNLLYKYSKDGRIPHEISVVNLAPQSKIEFDVAGKRMNTMFMSIDSNPLWILAEIHRAMWTGRSIKKRRLEKIRNFLASCDTDHDGFVENSFKKGLIGWPETWADDRDGACIDINTWWLESESAYAGLLNYNAQKIESKWKKFEKTFFEKHDEKWDFFDSVQGGLKKKVKSAMAVVPTMYRRGEIYTSILKSAYNEDMLTSAGLRSISTLDKKYDGGYHTGKIWPLLTGWLIIGCYYNSMKYEAWKALTILVNLSFSSSDPGRIREIYNSETYSPEGEFVQTWSSSILIQSVIEGLFGLRIKWFDRKHNLSIDSNNLPEGWNKMELKMVKYRGKLYRIRVTKKKIRVMEEKRIN